MQASRPSYSRNSCNSRRSSGLFFLIPLFFVTFFVFRWFVFWPILLVIFIVILASKPRYYHSNYYQPRYNSNLNNYSTSVPSQNVKINYCKNCGSFIEQDSLYCSECGQQL